MLDEIRRNIFDDLSESLSKTASERVTRVLEILYHTGRIKWKRFSMPFCFCNENCIFTIHGVVGVPKPISPVCYFLRLFLGIMETRYKTVFMYVRSGRRLASVKYVTYESDSKDLTDIFLGY